MHLGLRVMYLLLLHDFNRNRYTSTNCSKTSQHQILWKFHSEILGLTTLNNRWSVVPSVVIYRIINFQHRRGSILILFRAIYTTLLYYNIFCYINAYNIPSVVKHFQCPYTWPFSTECTMDLVESTNVNKNCKVCMGQERALVTVRHPPSLPYYSCNHCPAM
jgi:hypothetical protein